tara:strand:+ start:1019 stop:1546 length:528 start_codon:yes stop_codon:yes gene_type:complete
MILGLDISTSVIGIAVLDEDKNLVSYDAIKFKPDVSLEERADFLSKEIQTLNTTWRIKHVFVEQPFIAFSGGKTTAVTMSKLQRFNGMCCYGLYCIYRNSPTLIQANKARGLVGIKVRRGEKAKPVVLAWVKENYKGSFSYEMTRHGNPKPTTYDMADAVVVARAGIELLNQENT